jgi:hypothetical protein
MTVIGPHEKMRPRGVRRFRLHRGRRRQPDVRSTATCQSSRSGSPQVDSAQLETGR